MYISQISKAVTTDDFHTFVFSLSYVITFISEIEAIKCFFSKALNPEKSGLYVNAKYTHTWTLEREGNEKYLKTTRYVFTSLNIFYDVWYKVSVYYIKIWLHFKAMVPKIFPFS